MKVCQQCGTRYDDAMMFCLNDGGTLVEERAGMQSNPNAPTAAYNAGPGAGGPPSYGSSPGSQSGPGSYPPPPHQPPPYQPSPYAPQQGYTPPGSAPYGAAPAKKSSMPIVLALVAAVLLLGGGVFAVYKMTTGGGGDSANKNGSSTNKNGASTNDNRNEAFSKKEGPSVAGVTVNNNGGGSSTSESVESVAGSVWRVSFGSGGTEYDYTYHPDGTLSTTGSGSYKGKWTQSGRTVTVKFGETLTETGTIQSDGRMTGASNAGANFTAVRKGSAGSSTAGGDDEDSEGDGSVAGTVWHFKFGGTEYDYRFNPDGSLSVTGSGTYTGSWTQSGKKVTIRFPDGTIENATITGEGRITGSNTQGTRCTATLKSGGTTSGGHSGH